MITPILAAEMRLVERPEKLGNYFTLAHAVITLRGEERNMAVSMRITATGGLAKTLASLNEGDKVLASGELKTMLVDSGHTKAPVMLLEANKLVRL